jgi:DNA-binding PadR family transcriptional regulator
MREAGDAVEMYELSHGGQAELTDILIKYGKTEQEIRKIGL